MSAVEVGGNIVPFNPLDKKNLGEMVAEALLRSHPHPLGSVPSFKGAGIYAIYYVGDFADYAAIAERNRDGRFAAPIYVGKAIPQGGRKGAVEDATNTTALSNRLREHARSIRAATTTLHIDDFFCRYLIVDDVWIPLGESLLIAKAAPVWNKIVDGFGNHTPGAGRIHGKLSRWDIIHPGRGRTSAENPVSALEIRQDVKEYIRTFIEQQEPLLPLFAHGQPASSEPDVEP